MKTSEYEAIINQQASEIARLSHKNIELKEANDIYKKGIKETQEFIKVMMPKGGSDD